MSLKNQAEPKEAAAIAPRQPAAIFYGWWVVFAAGIGLALHVGPIVGGTFGLFLKPLSQQFGWSRGQISLAFSLTSIAGMVSAPLVGRLVDYAGARRVLLPAIFCFGLSLLSLALLSSQLWLFYTIYFLIGVAGSGTTPVPYAKVITRWFGRRRGLALGLSVAASSLSFALMPSLARALIAGVGWRGAYLVIGLMVLGIAIPVVALLVKEDPQLMGLQADGASADWPTEAKHSGEDRAQVFSQAWRTNTFWLIAGAFFLMSVSFHGCIVHLVPLLTDRGFSARDAAIAASLVGVGGLLARLGVGYLLDLFFAPLVAVVFFSSSTIGLVLLWSGAPGYLPFVAAFLVGVGQGAELDVIPYLVSRYFGLPAFAHLYGYLFAAFLLGAAVGPPIMGVGFDAMGSYGPVLAALAICTLLAVGLVSRIGPYPEPPGPAAA